MVARTLTTDQIAALRLATVDEMVGIAASIPQVDQKSWKHYNGGPATFLEISPGAVRIHVQKPGQHDHEADLALRGRYRNVDAAVAQVSGLYNSDMAALTDVDLEVLSAPDVLARAVRGKPSLSKRGKIMGWSRKSRNRMQLRLGSLDWTPLFEDGLEPAMVTLTMPGNWEELAPTPAEFRRMVGRFRSAYADAWGSPSTGVWKLEFQRRGAPHVHILMTPPAGVAQGMYPFEFRHWLSMAWARAVGAKGEDRLKHEKAGTGVDYVGEAYRNPRLIAKYFGKHGTFNAKEYQNQMPMLWLDAIDRGESGIQFWGVWGLKKAVGVLQLSDETGAVNFARIGTDLSAAVVAATYAALSVIARWHTQLERGSTTASLPTQPASTVDAIWMSRWSRVSSCAVMVTTACRDRSTYTYWPYRPSSRQPSPGPAQTAMPYCDESPSHPVRTQSACIASIHSAPTS